MRVPTRTIHETMQQALQSNYSALVDAQRQLVTGKRLTKVSDGPADAVNAVRLRGKEQMIDAHVSAAEDGLSMLGSQDTALQQVSSLLQRARELMISGASDIEGEHGREAIAVELEGLRDQLVVLANTTHEGRSVFGGFSPTAVTQVAGTVTFTGDASSVDRRVGEDLVVTVNTNGRDVFGFTAGDSVFALLNRVVTNVRTGNGDAVRGDLATLESRHADVTNSLGSIGGRMNQLEQAREKALTGATDARATRSQLEDVDLGAAAVDLKDAETAYNATLAVIARMQQVSLLDFLR